MAIIKTKLVNGDRRIITKVVGGQRRVSCSCCPSDVECCMYPAIAYTNGLYEFEDLPDEVEFWHNDEEGGSLVVGPIILPKNESAGEFFYGSGEPSPRISHFADEWIVGVNQIEPGLGDCLILDKLTIEPAPAAGDGTRSIWVFDRFEDTYYFSDGPTNANNIALNRISLCVWESEEWLSYASFGPSQTDYYGQAVLKYVENIKAYYSGVTWDSLNPPEKNGFVFEIAEYVSGGLIGYKENPQNKPDGTYIGATTPTIGRNVVITE